MNVIPFGRTPAERRRNAESAERAATKPRHPAAPPSRRGSTCKVCERKFAHGTAVPADRVCRDCRYDMQHNGPTEPPPDPSLF